MTDERSREHRPQDDATLGDDSAEAGRVQAPPQVVGDQTKVPLEDTVWRREGTDAPDAADIEDPSSQL